MFNWFRQKPNDPKNARELGNQDSEAIKIFVKRVVDNRLVYLVQGAEGQDCYPSSKNQDAVVLLFFSEVAYARRLQTESDSQVEQVDLFDFLYKWLPAMHDDGDLVGPDWTADLAGPELDPLELRSQIEAEMSTEHLREYEQRCIDRAGGSNVDESESCLEEFVSCVADKCKAYCLVSSDGGLRGRANCTVSGSMKSNGEDEEASLLLFFSEQVVADNYRDHDEEVSEIEVFDLLNVLLPDLAENGFLVGLDWGKKAANEVVDALLLRQLIESALTLECVIERYQSWGKMSELELHYQNTLEMSKQTLPSFNAKDQLPIAQCHNKLAALYHLTGKYAEEEEQLKEALKIQERSLGFHHKDLCHTLDSYARLLQITNRISEGQEVETRSNKIRSAQKR